jgi:hypothetical protein
VLSNTASDKNLRRNWKGGDGHPACPHSPVAFIGTVDKTDKSYRQNLRRKSVANLSRACLPAVSPRTAWTAPNVRRLSAEGISVKSNWLTLAFVVSLGLMAAVGLSNQSWLFAADGAPATSEPGGNDEHGTALELLKQAAAELQAQHLDAAKRLAQQASALNAHYSLFDVRPEHLLAEIERRERAGGPTAKESQIDFKPISQAAKRGPIATSMVAESTLSAADPFATSTAENAVPNSTSEPAPKASAALTQLTSVPPADVPASSDRIKARAIEMLDLGLQALDEKRIDDADRYARAALSLHAAWNKFEYKPENLITEIGIARASQRLIAAQSQPVPQSNALSNSGEGSIVREANGATEKPVPAPAAAPPQNVASQPPTISAGATSPRERAERLLQEAMVDLHEGRDDVARSRIEGALGAIHPTTPRQLPMSWPSNMTSPAATRPAGAPAYTIDRALDARDVALKPMHDPFLGDDPMLTQKSTAGEKSMREGNPYYVSPNPNYNLNRPLPVIGDDPSQANAANQHSQTAAASTSRIQTIGESQNQAAAANWPETEAAQSGPQKFAPSTLPAASQQIASRPYGQISEPRVTAPIAPPIQPDPKWSSPSRTPYAPPTTDPMAPAPSEDHPGYFRRLWNTMRGE